MLLRRTCRRAAPPGGPDPRRQGGAARRRRRMPRQIGRPRSSIWRSCLQLVHWQRGSRRSYSASHQRHSRAPDRRTCRICSATAASSSCHRPRPTCRQPPAQHQRAQGARPRARLAACQRYSGATGPGGSPRRPRLSTPVNHRLLLSRPALPAQARLLPPPCPASSAAPAQQGGL